MEIQVNPSGEDSYRSGAGLTIRLLDICTFPVDTVHKTPICALIGEYEGMRVKFNLVWRCRSTWGGRRRNLTIQQLQSFLACFPQTIVNLDSRMETIFQKGKRILIVRGKCWVACIISTSLRGGLTSLPSSAPTSPSAQIFGVMHGQHNLHDDQQVSPFL